MTAAVRDSLCTNPRWCVQYDHRHCTVCDAAIDHVNGDYAVCSTCNDDACLVCVDCARANPACAGCRAEAR